MSESVTSPRADRLYGAVALALLALAAFFALRGGPADGASTVPRLAILAPATRTSVDQPVAMEFDAGEVLTPGDTWWTAQGRHVHLRLGGAELMAARADLQPLGGTRYRWILPRLPTGDQTLQLYWSDAAHRPLRSGASLPIHIWLPPER